MSVFSSTATTTSLDCSASGFDNANTDCDDSDGSVSALQTYYVDGDSDGFGDPNNPVTECSLTPSTGNVTDNTDCDDSSDSTFPGAAPNDSATACMSDADGDDYGSTTAPSGGSAGTDCDDSSDTTFPGAAPNDSATACMSDADGDDYGSTTAPSGGIAGGDCDDAESNTHPYADENSGDGVDSNCDQLENAGIQCNGTWHIDTNASESVYLLACNSNENYSTSSNRCTGTNLYDGVASLLNDDSDAEHATLTDLFKDPSGLGLSGSAITTNADYNHWLSYTGFNINSGNSGTWADGTSDVPNWEMGKPDGDGSKLCAGSFYNVMPAESQVYNQSCGSTFELLTCSYRP